MSEKRSHASARGASHTLLALHAPRHRRRIRPASSLRSLRALPFSPTARTSNRALCGNAAGPTGWQVRATVLLAAKHRGPGSSSSTAGVILIGLHAMAPARPVRRSRATQRAPRARARCLRTSRARVIYAPRRPSRATACGTNVTLPGWEVGSGRVPRRRSNASSRGDRRVRGAAVTRRERDRHASRLRGAIQMCAPRRRSLVRLGGARVRVEREHEPPPAERERHRERCAQPAAQRTLGAPKARQVGERRLVEPLTSPRRDGDCF